MAKKPVQAKGRIVSAAEFAQTWDTERKLHELDKLIVTIRGTTMYIPAKTKSDFEDEFHGPVMAVRYKTFPDFRVWLTPCKPGGEDSRNLNPTSDTESAAQMGFAIPLRKLGIRIPASRKYLFPLEKIPVEDGGAVYELTFQDFESMRRQVDEEAARAVRQAKAEQAKAKRAAKRAERLAKATGKSSGAAGEAPRS